MFLKSMSNSIQVCKVCLIKVDCLGKHWPRLSSQEITCSRVSISTLAPVQNQFAQQWVPVVNLGTSN